MDQDEIKIIRERVKQYEQYYPTPNHISDEGGGKTAKRRIPFSTLFKNIASSKCIITCSVIALLAIVIIGLCDSTKNGQHLYRIQQDGLYGFIDSTGQVIIKPQYKYVSEFTDEGLALVVADVSIDGRTKIRYGIINRSNKLVMDTTRIIYMPYEELEEQFDNLDFNSDFLPSLVPHHNRIIYQDLERTIKNDYIVSDEVKFYGFMDVNGKIVTPCNYMWTSDLCDLSFNENGMAIAGRQNGNKAVVNLINTNGDVIIHDVIIATKVCNGEQWIKVPSDVCVMAKSEGCSVFKMDRNDKRTKWILIDKNGNTLKMVTGLPDSVGIIRTDCGINAIVDKDSTYIYDNNMNFTSLSGSMIDLCLLASEGHLAMRGNWNGEKGWAFIDSTLTHRSVEVYDIVWPFHNGVAPVCKNKKWGVVNQQFKLIIPFKYDFIGRFNHGLAYFSNHGNHKGYINTTGDIVWESFE